MLSGAAMGPVRIRHGSHEIATQPSHSVDRAESQAKMASIEFGYHDVMHTGTIGRNFFFFGGGGFEQRSWFLFLSIEVHYGVSPNQNSVQIRRAGSQTKTMSLALITTLKFQSEIGMGFVLFFFFFVI